MVTPNEEREIEWYQTKGARNSFIEYAKTYCTGVQLKHYGQFVDWYFKKKRTVAFNPMLFVQYLTRTLYDIEQLKNKKMNRDKVQVHLPEL